MESNIFFFFFFLIGNPVLLIFLRFTLSLLVAIDPITFCNNISDGDNFVTCTRTSQMTLRFFNLSTKGSVSSTGRFILRFFISVVCKLSRLVLLSIVVNLCLILDNTSATVLTGGGAVGVLIILSMASAFSFVDGSNTPAGGLRSVFERKHIDEMFSAGGVCADVVTSTGTEGVMIALEADLVDNGVLGDSATFSLSGGLFSE
uniref:Uncharacterized protein n=1 Tax=Panstrongylus lignarius TaxID=156445 RepID=A0A224XKM2_9HEMI